MAYMESIKFGVVLACFLSGSEIMILLIMLAFLRLIDDKWKGVEDVCLCAGEFAPESEERDSVKEEEIVRSAKKEEASAPAPSEEPTAPDQAAKAEESEEEEEEEKVEEFTEIVETFQSSEDGGKTWKTYRKIIRITPEGTSENVELIEDTSAPGSNFAAEAASRLSSQPDAQVKAQRGSDVDGKALPASSGLVLCSPGQEEGGVLSDTGLSPMSEGSYKEGPAPVPEPTLPEDFLEEEEQYQEFGLKGDLGDEGFIDRREETIAVIPEKLSPEEIPEREEEFKVCLNDYSPAGSRRRFFSPGTGQGKRGDDNNDIIGAPGDEDYGYTHRVVMKKEVHQRTTIRPDGQEDTVITEDSQIHQDSDPPGELRQSMEQIIQQFMHDSPRTQRQEDEPDEGTEV